MCVNAVITAKNNIDDPKRTKKKRFEMQVRWQL